MSFGTYEEFLGTSGWEQGRSLLGLSPGQDFNLTSLIVDRHCEQAPDRPALIHRTYTGERSVVSFQDLHDGMARFASVLDGLGIQKGDRVFTLLEPQPELYYAILGTIRIGAIIGPLFSAFGTAAIADRLADSNARVLVTSPRHLSKIHAALGELPDLEHILVLGEDINETGLERDLGKLLQAAPTERAPANTTSEDPMILHYSSGTTGKPKGVLHVHEAIVGHAITTRVVLDLTPDDLYWCTADPGWVTGTSYGIFGPWALGITQVAYSGGFSSEAWYSLMQDEKVTVWYTSPTALRMLMRDGTDVVAKHDLSSVRHICSVGEPLNPEVIRWGEGAFSYTIRDTWWQTETGCMQIVNYPFMDVRSGSMGRPFAGVTTTVVDPVSFEPLGPKREGILALKPEWPSMFRTYWGKPDLYAEKFQNGWYLTGDRAYLDEDGYVWFVGRDDDVINTSGHLVGPFEIENAVLEHAAVVEAAAFPIPDEGAGDAVAVAVVLAQGIEQSRELVRELKTCVRRRVGPHAAPREVIITDKLPRTRSGKIMRRVARAEFLGLPTGDISALED